MPKINSAMQPRKRVRKQKDAGEIINKNQPQPKKTERKQPKTRSRNVDRGAVEKHRRQQMKDLCSSLDSLLPPLTSCYQGKLPATDLLDRSVGYVNQLKERVEQLRSRRDGLKEDLSMAAVEINEKGSELAVNLVTGLNKGFMLDKVVNVLEEEGARVLSANYCRLRDRIIYSITSQAFYSRIGIETSRVLERLKILSGSHAGL